MIDQYLIGVVLTVLVAFAYNWLFATKKPTKYDKNETVRRKSINIAVNISALQIIATFISMHPFFDKFDETGVLQSKIYLAFTGCMILTWFYLHKKLKESTE